MYKIHKNSSVCGTAFPPILQFSYLMLALHHKLKVGEDVKIPNIICIHRSI